MTLNRVLAALSVAMGLLALLPGGNAAVPGGPAETSALDVARALRKGPGDLHVIDVRSSAAFDDFHLPRALHVPFERDSARSSNLAIENWLQAFAALDIERGESIVVVGGPEASAREVWLALRWGGFQASYMPLMLDDWLDTIVSPVRAPTDDPGELARWEERASLSRYFGGLPRVIDRPVGDLAASSDPATRLQRARRRGCAF